MTTKSINPYFVNIHSLDCCICLETPSRIMKCDKCKDGVVCVSCFKKQTKIENAKCSCCNPKILLISYSCPICRNYGVERIDHHTNTKYEFTDNELLDKIIDYSKDEEVIIVEESIDSEEVSIYNSDEELTDDEEETELLEEYINNSINLPSIHSLNGIERQREADRQARFIDIIQNVYTLNILFGEHFLLNDY